MKHGHSSIKLGALTVLLVAQFGSSLSAVPLPPDAGQTLNELQKQPERTLPKTVTPLLPEEDKSQKTTVSDDVRITVKAIRVSGSSKFTASELEALVADLIGGEHTLADLEAATGRITAYYRARGYVVARAYLPAQEIKDGVVSVDVMEGYIGKQSLNNSSRLSDQSANRYLRVVKSGDVLQAKPVNRALLLLNDTPGVGSARATLQPGASAGTTDLIVELTPAALFSGNIELDNYGNYYTGENRLGAELAFNSPLKAGDRITLRALVSDQNMTYAYAGYQIPVGGSGLRLGAAYADTKYSFGQNLAASHGSASSASVFAMYPFIRSQDSNLSGTLSLENKQLNDVKATIPFDKQVWVNTVGMAGNFQDALGGAGMTFFDLSLAAGRLSMDAISLLIDNLSAHANGDFARFDYNLDRLQRLNDSNSLSLALSGQYANKNLNSSEQFSLGGANSVRAYPQGEVYGDEGWLATVELRHSFAQTLQGAIFYDAGSVNINHNPYLASSNSRFLSGAGAGMNMTLLGMQLKAYLAFRAGGGRPVSEPASINSEYRLWLQLGKQF